MTKTTVKMTKTATVEGVNSKVCITLLGESVHLHFIKNNGEETNMRISRELFRDISDTVGDLIRAEM